MKTSASFLVASFALAGLAQAGWDKPTSTLSYNALCGLSFVAPSTKHICFAGPADVSQISAGTSFHGFVQPGSKTNFVIYKGDGKDTAYYQSKQHMININWTVTGKGMEHCVAYDAQSIDGQPVENGIWCPSHAMVSLPTPSGVLTT
ncbi:hypothetical protein PSEUBRA_003987 [Kalmanozyma brasiliensis GHG001]|uniref:uncharacterized protein n=1 Tax=Kalmanozyma brasiliensis (strain GHG001) TaxID=1365824 RepID=UPI0028680341|nr:uncharacterized protein PSEUBRA_003987 [Kalmanozyma brasiliensis GHG001]KAF6767324.1 hypothetical protein PSEUBRA_003987 [Kalmanozyma brasiliensis GHG001]